MLESAAIDVDTLIFDYYDIMCTDPRMINTSDGYDEAMRNCINFETNNIWFQEPQANALVHKGESITLFVSKGEYTPELYPVPYSSGKSNAIKWG